MGAEPGPTEPYVCPACRSPVARAGDVLRCSGCSAAYPILGGIPDFLPRHADAMSGAMDTLAPLYETRLWYPVVLRIFGGAGVPSAAEAVRMVRERAAVAAGRILDVACGPGTVSRGMASPSRPVYGVDVSMGMLRQGRDLAIREGVRDVRFARADVAALPFPDGTFDAAVCSGALHLFPDPAAALREIARVSRPGARLAVLTFVLGAEDNPRLRRLRERAWERRRGTRPFEPTSLERLVREAGFEGFEADVRGALVVFGARRSGP